MKLSDKSVLDRLRSRVFCRLRPSKIHGIGVFAIKDIPSGICPWSTANHHIPQDVTTLIRPEELDTLDEAVLQALYDYNLKSSYGLFISPHELDVLHITQFLNYSEDPNLDFLVKEEGEFITNREIKTGEELTVDYKKALKNTDLKYNL